MIFASFFFPQADGLPDNWSLQWPFLSFVACVVDGCPIVQRHRNMSRSRVGGAHRCFTPCICICICNPFCQNCRILHLAQELRGPFIPDGRKPLPLTGHLVRNPGKPLRPEGRFLLPPAASPAAHVPRCPPTSHRHSYHHRVPIASQPASPASQHRRNLSIKTPCFSLIKNHPLDRSPPVIGAFMARFWVTLSSFEMLSRRVYAVVQT